MPDTNNWLGGTSRRDFLRYGAAGGVALLAGCGGGGVDRTDRTFTIFDPSSGTPPAERHLNPWNPTEQGTWHPGANIFDPAVVHSPANNEGYGIIANSWEMVDDTTMEFELSDEWTWHGSGSGDGTSTSSPHDGDPVTAHDWQLQFDIGTGLRELNNSPHPLIEGAEAVDDTTLQVNFRSALDDSWAIQNATGDIAGQESRGIFTKAGMEPWEDWRSRIQEAEPAEGDEDLPDIYTEITSASEPMLTEGAVSNGPFEVTSIGDTVITMELYEDYPNADSIRLKEMELQNFQSGIPTQPYLAGKVDAAHSGFPIDDNFEDELPDGHTLFRETLSSNKLVAFNCGGQGVTYDTPFRDHRVRKAVCHVYDRSELAGNLSGVKKVFEWGPCRVPGNVLKEDSHEAATWVKDSFTTYGQNNTERATELLEEAGYSREDGEWYRPDGSRFEIEWMDGVQRQDHQVMQDSLEAFGIAINQQSVDGATLDERRTAGEYHVMPDGSSANGITSMWTLELIINWLQTILHFDDEADIPMPVGDPDGSDGTKTINIQDHITQWQTSGDSQYHKELMWWWNQFIPEMEMMYQPNAGAYNGSNWELDARDAIVDGVEDALYIAPKMEDGTLRYVGPDTTPTTSQ